MRKTTAAACGATALVLGLSGCGASFEGSGSKDAASAEQLAMHADDPWDAVVQIDPVKKCDTPLRDGVYTGTGKAMAGNVTVTLLVDDNRITCLETAQDGETQSVGGFEAVRDGTFAKMIEASQGSDIDTVSGATITTAGVKQAVDDALAQAADTSADQAKSGN
ncbi:FMN-binding protein [uncultured Senegalimassilia sp.]|uniref:FMN-binding protein n=1 Tax=uncultured Senegalimassilia sp. TaxID=1714350 RepID=UPI0025E102AB|nr:FMN-binding protein [uncultured Senegalimassilia sp.]